MFEYMTIREMYEIVQAGVQMEMDQIEYVQLQGWIRTNRCSGKLGFIELNDGTYFRNAQLVYKSELKNFDEVELDNIFGGIAYDEIQDEQEPSVVEEVESKNFDWDEIGNWDDLDAKDNEDEIAEENGYFHKPNASDLMDTPSSTKGKFDAGTTTKPPESGFFSGVSKGTDVPPVVFELDKDISPDFQAAVSTPQPIDAGPSILDSFMLY